MLREPTAEVILNGTPERTRTPNPQIRSLMLYPIELLALHEVVLLSNGVDDGARTRDTQCHKLVLYQLNYIHHKLNDFTITFLKNKWSE